MSIGGHSSLCAYNATGHSGPCTCRTSLPACSVCAGWGTLGTLEGPVCLACAGTGKEGTVRKTGEPKARDLAVVDNTGASAISLAAPTMSRGTRPEVRGDAPVSLSVPGKEGTSE